MKKRLEDGTTTAVHTYSIYCPLVAMVTGNNMTYIDQGSITVHNLGLCSELFGEITVHSEDEDSSGVLTNPTTVCKTPIRITNNKNPTHDALSRSFSPQTTEELSKRVCKTALVSRILYHRKCAIITDARYDKY